MSRLFRMWGVIAGWFWRKIAYQPPPMKMLPAPEPKRKSAEMEAVLAKAQIQRDRYAEKMQQLRDTYSPTVRTGPPPSHKRDALLNGFGYYGSPDSWSPQVRHDIRKAQRLYRKIRP